VSEDVCLCGHVWNEHKTDVRPFICKLCTKCKTWEPKRELVAPLPVKHHKPHSKYPFLYHGTPKSKLKSVLKLGLCPDYSDSHNEWPMAVYLTDDPTVAQSYAGHNGFPASDWVVLQIPTSALDYDDLMPDDYDFPDVWDRMDEAEQATYPDANENWATCPWYVSMAVCSQVAYLKKIPPEVIKVYTPGKTATTLAPVDPIIAERDAKFQELAYAQRGAPEDAMLRCQHHPLGAGIGPNALEHVGDLTWRMSDRFSQYKGQPGAMMEKVEKTLRWLTNDYGFQREMNGNMLNNYEARKPRLSGKSYDELKAEFFGLWDAYAEAHSQLRVFNYPQRIARDAAVALGKRDFARCIVFLRQLETMLNKGRESWFEEAGAYKPAKIAKVYTTYQAQHSRRYNFANLPSFYDLFESGKPGCNFGIYDLLGGEDDWQPYEDEAKSLAERRGVDLDEMEDKDEWIYKNVARFDLEARYNKLREFFAKMQFPVTAYRALDLKNFTDLRTHVDTRKTKNKLVPWSNEAFGHAWAWDEKGADTYGSNYRGSDDYTYVFRGLIGAPTDVDWETTLQVNFLMPEEHEIRLIDGSSIEITGYKKPRTSEWLPPEANFKTVVASHKTPALSTTTFPNMDKNDGEGSNAYALLPQFVEGMNNEPKIDTLLGGKPASAPQHPPPSLKAAARVQPAIVNFDPLPFEEFLKQEGFWSVAQGMDEDEMAMREQAYAENVEHFGTIEFPLTVWRAVEVPEGEPVNLEQTGIYWSWVENSADAYFGGSSMWGQGRGGKKGELAVIKAQILHADDVDWKGTMHANFVDPEENEVRVFPGTELKLLGIQRGDDFSYKPVPGQMNLTAAAVAETPTQSVTDTPQFKAWFGNSEVVDTTGKPLVVYHGTSVDDDFESFDTEGTGMIFFASDPAFASIYAQATNGRVIPCYLKVNDLFDYRRDWQLALDFWEEDSYLLDEFWIERLTSDYHELLAEQLTDEQKEAYGADQFVEQIKQGNWVAIECDMFIRWLRDRGCDGLTMFEHGSVNYAVFEADQIKSAVGNNGEFNDSDRITASKTSRMSDVLPTFDVFVKQEGGFDKLFASIADASSDWEQYYEYFDRDEQERFENLPDSQRDKIAWKRAYDDWHYHYDEVVQMHDSWSWPMKVWRAVTLKSPNGLKTNGIGVYWAYEENGAEAHWGGFGKGERTYILEAEITEAAVDWVSTMYANLSPSLGEDEKEITLKKGAQIKLLRYQDEGGVWKKALPAWKNVTAGLGDRNAYIPRTNTETPGLHSDPLFPEEMEPKVAYYNNDMLWLKHYLTMSQTEKAEEFVRTFPEHFADWLEEQEEFTPPMVPAAAEPKTDRSLPTSLPGPDDPSKWVVKQVPGGFELWNGYGSIVAKGKTQPELLKNWQNVVAKAYSSADKERKGRGQQDFFERLREHDEDALAAVPKQWLQSFMDDQGDEMMREAPADCPSFMHMSFETIVKNQWLVHKTDDPDGICHAGFTIGMDDLSRLGLTTYYKDAGKRGGYNFAFPANDNRSIRAAEDKYGSDAVIFRASGIEVYHYGDEERQVIFRGSEAHDIIPVYKNSEGWNLADDDHGKPVFQADYLWQIVQWVENHYAQYRKVIVKRASFEQ
jgi:hypothetical protein